MLWSLFSLGVAIFSARARLEDVKVNLSRRTTFISFYEERLLAREHESKTMPENLFFHNSSVR